MKPTKPNPIHHLNRSTSEYARRTISSLTTSLYSILSLLNNNHPSEALSQLYELHQLQGESSPEDIWYFSMISYQIALVLMRLGRWEEARGALENLKEKLGKQGGDGKGGKEGREGRVRRNSCQVLLCKCVVQQIVAVLMGGEVREEEMEGYLRQLEKHLGSLDETLRDGVLHECSLILLGTPSLSLSPSSHPSSLYSSQHLALLSLLHNNYPQARNYTLHSLKHLKILNNTRGMVLGMIYLTHINEKMGKDVAGDRQEIRRVVEKEGLEGMEISRQLKNVEVVKRVVGVLGKFQGKNKGEGEGENVEKYRLSIHLKLKRAIRQLLVNKERIVGKMVEGQTPELERELIEVGEKVQALLRLEYEMRQGEEEGEGEGEVGVREVMGVLGKYKFAMETAQRMEDRVRRMGKIVEGRIVGEAFGEIFERGRG